MCGAFRYAGITFTRLSADKARHRAATHTHTHTEHLQGEQNKNLIEWPVSGCLMLHSFCGLSRDECVGSCREGTNYKSINAGRVTRTYVSFEHVQTVAEKKHAEGITY